MFAISDIHGCLDSLHRLLAQLPADAELIFLGDCIDRGPRSAGVIEHLLQLRERRPCVFLMGNHEWMMLEALRSGEYLGSWLAQGGRETLASYHLDLRHVQADPAALWERLPSLHRAFFRSLQPYHETETHLFVHAGIDVSLKTMAEQPLQTLLWIREPFLSRAASWEGKPVVFGHVPTFTQGSAVGEVLRLGRCRGIDGGCVYGGALLALDTASGKVYRAAGERHW